jgi:predicted DNA-binding protein YlxM (UPF0122 family)
MDIWNQRMVRKMFDKTNYTIQEMTDELGIGYKSIWNYIKDTYTVEQRKQRKIKNYSKSKLGSKNPMFGKHPSNYIGECSDGKGYLTIYKPSWYTGRLGSERVFVHTVVMCEFLGITELPAGFIVHHIDKDKTNNDINNLALMTNSAHQRLHLLERATTRAKVHRAEDRPKRTAVFDREYISIL